MGAKEDLASVSKRLKQAIRGKGQQQKKLLNQMGLVAIDLIVDRTRKGKGVKKTGGNRVKLKALSKAYIKYRKTQKLHSTTSPRKSNLTFTGQMLESVKILKSTKDSAFSIGPSGRRKDGKRNADVSRWVTEKGRPFMNLGKVEIRELHRILEARLKERVRKL